MNIKRLEFILTQKCNSQCAHCQGYHGPKRRGVMEVQHGLTYLEETTSVTKLSSFMIFGGEPMLYPERAIRLFQKARKLGIPEIELITNGFWGKYPEEALDFAIKLKEAGVTDVIVSVDAFHVPYIPLDFPRNAAKASVKAGIERVRWNVAVLESIDVENEYDSQTRQILRTLEPENTEAHFNRILPQGRARENLKQFFPVQPLDGPCPEKEEALVNPRCISMEPEGWVAICWNMAIGNTKEKRLSELLTGYRWERHPVIKTLVEKGPLGLIDLPESKGFVFREDNYIDRCHLCSDVRKSIRRAYPEMYT